MQQITSANALKIALCFCVMFYYHHIRAHVFSGRRVWQKHVMIHRDAIISTGSENSCNLAQTPTFFSDRYALVTDLDRCTQATWLTIDIYVSSESIFVAYRQIILQKYKMFTHTDLLYTIGLFTIKFVLNLSNIGLVSIRTFSILVDILINQGWIS